MKRILIIFCLIAFLLCGCSSAGQRYKSPVTFYYIQEQYQYGSNAGVVSSEEREAAGHTEDLSYLMALYLMGPSEDGLVSPISRGTRVLEVKRSGTSINLSLSDTVSSMSDTDFTKACACITLTLLDLTDAQKVTIQSGTRNVTMSRDTIILFDNSHLEESQ